MMASSGRTAPLRVAIIGGGCGAMTAADFLTRPEQQGRFAVTVFQEGWRLGGKGASGRGASGRIEEHGLHIWLGHYDNSFRMMRDCYAELEASAKGHLFGDWRDAFLPEPDIGLFSPHETGGWQRWTGRFPPRPGLPGDPRKDAPHSLAGYFMGALAMAQTLLLDVEVERRGILPPAPRATSDSAGILRLVQALLSRGVFAGAVVLVEAMAILRLGIGLLPPAVDSPLLRLADRVAAGLREWAEANLLADDRHRHIWELLDVVFAGLIGSWRAGLWNDPRGLDAIDDYDCKDWLRANGASERSLSSPFIRGLYDLGFAQDGGDPARPAFAAGSGTRGSLRMLFGYRGSLFWRMRAGMGDVVFAPLYEALKDRGVDFRFFHRLTNVGMAWGNAPHVARLEFDVQARVRAGGAYQPMVDVAGRPCWPSDPDWRQLEDGARLAKARPQFENHWDRTRAGTLRLEVGRDFDFVVLGTSIGAIPHVAPEILAHDKRWRDMVAHVKTTATQAFQIWLTEDLEQLGWDGPPYISSAFVKPFDTWCDMAHVIPEEAWMAPPATAIYFCSALKDPDVTPTDADTGYPQRRADEVKAAAAKFLEEQVPHLWPKLLDAEGRFRWSVLADAEGTSGEDAGPERFATQYWRANVSPSERYVLSLPGSGRFRISPLERSYDNLTIAGDWTACGLNSGCTESAVMSGMLAAHALSGFPKLQDIMAYDHP
jgi:uncharacterized protein with NAD-binding domain and iron-sulfur cluster